VKEQLRPDTKNMKRSFKGSFTGVSTHSDQ